MEYGVNLAGRVEVSPDSGTTWTPVFSHNGTDAREGAFSDKVASLAGFAGRQIQIRFNLINTGGFRYNCCHPLHWYFDDIHFVNLQEATEPMINNVAAGTAFAFMPTALSDFDLNVRPQFFGRYFGEWGPAKHVSTLGTPPPAPEIATQPQNQIVTVAATRPSRSWLQAHSR